VDFNGELYVADTKDQSIGLDPCMLWPESELQVRDNEVPDSEVRANEHAPLVVQEKPEKDWSTAAKPSSHRRLG
jgi:hypothetical protein